MSLTSYRTAPPRVGRAIVLSAPVAAFAAGLVNGLRVRRGVRVRPSKAWRRPTLPRLETQYHRRWGLSRPSSGWDRVLGPPQWPPDRRWTERAASRRFVVDDRRPPAAPVLAAARDGFSGEAIKPVERLVPVSFMHCCTSTPGLSTWSSATALGRDLVSRGASRLDAFSGYPVRT